MKQNRSFSPLDTGSSCLHTASSCRDTLELLRNNTYVRTHASIQSRARKFHFHILAELMADHQWTWRQEIASQNGLKELASCLGRHPSECSWDRSAYWKVVHNPSFVCGISCSTPKSDTTRRGVKMLNLATEKGFKMRSGEYDGILFSTPCDILRRPKSVRKRVTAGRDLVQ